MNTDLRIEQVKNEFIKIVNTSELSAGVVLYILNDITQQLRDIYFTNLKKEKETEAIETETEKNGED